jgi:hypothetical protein
MVIEHQTCPRRNRVGPNASSVMNLLHCCYARLMQAGRPLSLQAFEACFTQPMRNVTDSAELVLDIWPYVDSLDLDALGVPRVTVSYGDSLLITSTSL